MARFGDGLATGADLVGAAERAVRQALGRLDSSPDLVCVFVCGSDTDEVALAGERAMGMCGDAVTLGCSSTGVIGDGRGIEGQGAVSVWAAMLPDVTLTPFRLRTVSEEDHLAVVGMVEPTPNDRAGLLLANPYDFPVHAFMRRAAAVLGPLPLVGGLADGMGGRESVRLFYLGESLDSGAVGLLLGGEGVVGATVSQGCSPIGPAMAVTGAEGNVLTELAGTPAFTKLQEIIKELTPEEQELVSGGLHIGLAMDEYAESHERGDFLVRSVLRADPEAKTVTVGDVVEVGQTVRFQVRDRDTADTELLERLRRFHEDTRGRASGALLFSCTGRGAAMFPTPHHDVRLVQQSLGIGSVTGFFAAGEIGPVAGRSHLHSYTACLLAFTAGA